MQLQLTLPDATKQCGKCHEVTALSEFPKDRKSRDGYSWRCKSCAREADRLYRATAQGVEVHRVAKDKFRRRLAGEEAPFVPVGLYVLPKTAKTRSGRQSARQRIVRQIVIQDLKRHLGCQVCGESEPCALDLHHKDPSIKLTNVDRKSLRGWSIGKVISEVMKCNCLCSNCHRKAHAGVIDVSHIPAIDRDTLEMVLTPFNP